MEILSQGYIHHESAHCITVGSRTYRLCDVRIVRGPDNTATIYRI